MSDAPSALPSSGVSDGNPGNRTRKMTFRVTTAEWVRLSAEGARLGLSPAQLCREAGLDLADGRIAETPREGLSPADVKKLSELLRISQGLGTLLNQQVRALNALSKEAREGRIGDVRAARVLERLDAAAIAETLARISSFTHDLGQVLALARERLPRPRGYRKRALAGGVAS